MSMTLIETWNLSALCRCCHTDGEYKSLGATYTYKHEPEVYTDMLLDTLNVKIDPPPVEASYSICEECIVRLRDASKFRKQVLECERKFEEYCEMARKAIKMEIDSSDDGELASKAIKKELDNSDDDIPRLLHQWGFPQYIHTFEENNITIPTLSMLDSSLVKELIPLIGDRAKFLRKLDTWNKLPHPEECLEIPSTSSSPTLKNLLLKSNEGRGLLNLYSEQGKLSSNGRSKICNIIIKDLMESDPNKRIDSSRLLKKAQEITEVFKKENISTYFIPYMNDPKLKIKRCAKGKLYDCLQNRRRELRGAKVIKKKHNSNKPLRVDETESLQNRRQEMRGAKVIKKKHNTNEPLEVDETECILPEGGITDEDIQWLQNCTKPWHSVVEKWHQTAKYRIKEIETSEMTIQAYIKKYPVLKTPRGHELLTDDFQFLYPSSGNKIFETFPTIKRKIFNLASSKSQVPEVKDILEQLQLLNKDDKNCEETESILAFMLLPLLLGNRWVARTKNQVWRPSKAEVKDCFITHVLRPMDVQAAIAHRREKYSKFNLTLKPVIVIVGSSFMDIQKYYVVVNDIFYETKSILKTVDTCFKMIHSLHCQYPTESMCVWNFIQLGLYQLKTKWDKNYSTVNAFITDLDIDLK